MKGNCAKKIAHSQHGSLSPGTCATALFLQFCPTGIALSDVLRLNDERQTVQGLDLAAKSDEIEVE